MNTTLKATIAAAALLATPAAAQEKQQPAKATTHASVTTGAGNTPARIVDMQQKVGEKLDEIDAHFARKAAQEKAQKTPEQKRAEAFDSAKQKLADFESNPLKFDTAEKIAKIRKDIHAKLAEAKSDLTEQDEIRIAQSTVRAKIINESDANKKTYMSLHRALSTAPDRAEASSAVTHQFSAAAAQDVQRARALENRLEAATLKAKKDVEKKYAPLKPREVTVVVGQQQLADGSTRVILGKKTLPPTATPAPKKKAPAPVR